MGPGVAGADLHFQAREPSTTARAEQEQRFHISHCFQATES